MKKLEEFPAAGISFSHWNGGSTSPQPRTPSSLRSQTLWAQS